MHLRWLNASSAHSINIFWRFWPASKLPSVHGSRLIVMHGSRPKLPQPTDKLKFAVSVGKNRTGRMLYDVFTVSGFRAFCTLRITEIS